MQSIEEKEVYYVPHNFKKQGNIFGLFESRALIRAIIIVAPIAFIIVILPLSFERRLGIGVILLPLLFLLFVFEIDKVAHKVIRFYKARRIIYRKGNYGEESYYEKERKRTLRRKK